MKNKFMIALTIPLLMAACSPKESENAEYSEIKKLEMPNPISNFVPAPEEKNTVSTNIPEPGTNIPNPVITTQTIADTTGTGGGSKKTKDKTPTEENEKSAQKQIIQTADIKIQVKNLDRSADTIDMIVKKYGAYISTSNQQTSNGIAEGRMCIRVRQENFSAVIKEVMKQAEFTNYKNIRTDDVTAEYVDIESRLKTKKEVEARYMEILRSKARTITEVLQAENEIRVVHEEIEAKTGRLNLLKDQVAYSTINLEYYMPTVFTDEPAKVEVSYAGHLGDAFGAGWELIKKILIGLVYIWPSYILFIIVWIILRKTVFSRTKKIA